MLETDYYLNIAICRTARLKQENSALYAKVAEQEKELSQLRGMVLTFFGDATAHHVNSRELEAQRLLQWAQQKPQKFVASSAESTKGVLYNYLIQCQNILPPNCT